MLEVQLPHPDLDLDLEGKTFFQLQTREEIQEWHRRQYVAGREKYLKDMEDAKMKEWFGPRRVR